jgi:hypothetical protein
MSLGEAFWRNSKEDSRMFTDGRTEAFAVKSKV